MNLFPDLVRDRTGTNVLYYLISIITVSSNAIPAFAGNDLFFETASVFIYRIR